MGWHSSWWRPRKSSPVRTGANARRAGLNRDAGGDDAEENAVCYLQILMAAALPNVGSERMCRDMDEWGYSFRLGSAAAWFREDAEDARRWLIQHGLIDGASRLTYECR